MKYRVGQKGNQRNCCVNILLYQFMLNYFASLSSRPKPAVQNNVLDYLFWLTLYIKRYCILSPKRKVEFVFLFKYFMSFFGFILLIWTESGPIMSELVTLYCMTSSLLLQLYFLPLEFFCGFVVLSDNY